MQPNLFDLEAKEPASAKKPAAPKAKLPEAPRIEPVVKLAPEPASEPAAIPARKSKSKSES